MKKINAFYRNLIAIGGSDPEAAAFCTTDEINRLIVRGGLVFIPAILAFYGMFLMAQYSSASTGVASLCAIAWALIVFLIDRSLMSQTSDFITWGLVGRIFFAVLNSMVVAECILVIIFADSIQTQKNLVYDAALHATEKRFDTERNAIHATIQKYEQIKSAAQSTYFDEIDGNGGSGHRGFGSISAEKEKALHAADHQLDSVRNLASLNLARIDSLEISAVESLKSNNSYNLASSLNLLHGIKTGYIPIAAWMIRLLLLLVELMPVFLKFGGSNMADMYAFVLSKICQRKKDEMELILLNEMELIKAKSQYASGMVCQKAAYDNSINELDMYTHFVNEMSNRYAPEITQEDEEIPAINEKLSSKWKTLLERFAA